MIRTFMLDEYISSRIDSIEDELKENVAETKKSTTFDSSSNGLENPKLSDIKDEQKNSLYQKMKLNMMKNGSKQEKGKMLLRRKK